MFWEYNLINFLVCVFDTYLIYDFVGYYEGVSPRLLTKKSRITVILLQTVDKALLLQGFAIVGTAFLI